MVQLTDRNYHAGHVEHGELQVGSDRSFAWVFTVVFALIGLYPAFFSNGGPRLWSLAVAGAFFGLGLIVPSVLHPLNVLWMKFGLLLNKIVSPLILGLLFFVTVTPMGLLMRMLGKDFLSLKMQQDARSYWIERKPPGPPPETMKNQF